MSYQGRTGRGPTQIARSQLAGRLALAVYGALGAAAILRCPVLVLGFPESVWSVGPILSLSSALKKPLTIVPPASRVVAGSATLADLTATLLLLALPLALLGRRQLR